MKVTIVQYGGDFRADSLRFDAGGAETYQAQQYSHACVNDLGTRFSISIISATAGPYDTILPSGVRAIGAGLDNGFKPRKLIPFVRKTAPDRLVLGSPLPAVLLWAHLSRIPTITTLADSFHSNSRKSLIKNMLLGLLLNHAEWVGNHQVGACLSLQKINVNPNRIIPWDWPASRQPTDNPARDLRTGAPFNVVYVGSVSKLKGVSDLIEAVIGMQGVALTVVGHQVEPMPKGSNIKFLGSVKNDEVSEIMRTADAIVIPSRHEYPEGLPLTIYEALVSRTPIIASDHPMFLSALSNDRNAIIFTAGRPDSLAAAIRRLADNPKLYRMLSENSLGCWEALQIPVKWGMLLQKWLDGDKEWLRSHAMNSGLYSSRMQSITTFNYGDNISYQHLID